MGEIITPTNALKKKVIKNPLTLNVSTAKGMDIQPEIVLNNADVTTVAVLTIFLVIARPFKAVDSVKCALIAIKWVILLKSVPNH